MLSSLTQKLIAQKSALLFIFSFVLLAVPGFSADYYWVGGSGNWSDHNSHWATSSGGNSFHLSVPSPVDNVFFDKHSFTATGQTVTMDVNAFCSNMTWDSVRHEPTFSGASLELKVGGDFSALKSPFTFIHTGNTFQVSGDFIVTSSDLHLQKSDEFILMGDFVSTASADSLQFGGFDGLSATKIALHGSLILSPGTRLSASRKLEMLSAAIDTVDLAGNTLSMDIEFNNAAGTWVLKSRFQTEKIIYIQNGTFKSNGFNIQTEQDINAYYHQPSLTVDLTGTDSVIVGRTWLMHPVPTLIVDDAVFYMITDGARANSAFYGGHNDYNDVYIDFADAANRRMNFSDNNTFKDVTFLASSSSASNYLTFNHSSRYDHIVIADSGRNTSVTFAGAASQYDHVEVNVYGGGSVNFSAADSVGDLSIFMGEEQGAIVSNLSFGTGIDFYKDIEAEIVGEGTVKHTGTSNYKGFELLAGGSTTVQHLENRGVGENTFRSYKMMKGDPAAIFDVTVSNKSVYDTLLVPGGTSLTLDSTVEHIINEHLVLDGDGANIISLESTKSGQAAIITMGSNSTVQAGFLSIKDNQITGGPYTPVNSINRGNNTGWDFGTAATGGTYYWIGGTGQWSDPSHWAVTSGGAPSGSVPFNLDNVVFDANSFSAHDTVTLTASTTVNTMTWEAGIADKPRFYIEDDLILLGDLLVQDSMTWDAMFSLSTIAGDANLTVGGDIIIHEGVNWNQSGVVSLLTDSSNVTISIPHAIGHSIELGTPTSVGNPSWNLVSDLEIDFWKNNAQGRKRYGVSLENGNFNTNGNKIHAGNYWNANSGNLTQLDISGTDTVFVHDEWLVDTFATVTAGNATFVLSNPDPIFRSFSFNGGRNNYEHLYFSTHQAYRDPNHSISIENEGQVKFVSIYEEGNKPSIAFKGNNHYDSIRIVLDGNANKNISFGTQAADKTTFGNIHVEAEGGTSTVNVRNDPDGTPIDDIYLDLGEKGTVAFGGKVAVAGRVRAFAEEDMDITVQDTSSFTDVSMAVLDLASGEAPGFTINSATVFDSLLLPFGTVLGLPSNQEITIKEHLEIKGVCGTNASILGHGTSSINMVGSATVIADFVELSDHQITGPNTYSASNATDLGNISGWVLGSTNTGSDYYWVGGTGNWSDPAHWALTSGGSPNPCSPGVLDNVYFDSNSFTGASEIVTLDVPAEIKNMLWTSSVQHTPRFSGSKELIVQRDLKVEAPMLWAFGGTLILRGSVELSPNVSFSQSGLTTFESDSTNNVIDLAGKAFINTVTFKSATAGHNPVWNLRSDFWLNSQGQYARSVSFVNGSFISNGHAVNFGGGIVLTSNNTPKLLDFTGTDSIYVSSQWNMGTATSYADHSLIMGNATLVFRTFSRQSMAFYGGDEVYNDIVMDHFYSSDRGNYVLLAGDISVTDLYIRSKSYRRILFNTHASYRDVFVELIDPSASGNKTLSFTTASYSNSFRNFTYTNPYPNQVLLLKGNISAETVSLSYGNTVRFENRDTLRLKQLLIPGDCQNLTTIKSDRSTSPGKIIVTGNDSIKLDWVTLQDIPVEGPKPGAYIASNAITIGDITGWDASLIPDHTFYWIGGSGSWDDPQNWSISSGGPAYGCAIPGPANDVVFDVNSFPNDNMQVTFYTANIECHNMVWNTGDSSMTFTGNKTIKIYGSLQVNSPLLWSVTNQLYVYGSFILNSQVDWQQKHYTNFNGDNPNNIIDMAGNEFLHLAIFDGEQATWTLQDDFIIDDVTTTGAYFLIRAGEFVSNGYDVDGGYQMYLEARNNNRTILDFTGTDTITARRGWYVLRTNIQLTLGSSVILLETDKNEDIYFNGLGYTYNDVLLRHIGSDNRKVVVNGNNTFNNLVIRMIERKDVTINGNNTSNSIDLLYNYSVPASPPLLSVTGTNTVANFSIQSLGTQGPAPARFTQDNTFGSFSATGRGTRLEFGAGKTQTVDNFVILGTGSFPVLMNSTTRGTQTTISKANGDVCLDYVWLEDINATGGANFNSGASGVDINNNTGWTFASCSAFYWVGGSGNWSDFQNHWASFSGGPANQTNIPGPADDVYFDANSFSTPGQTVTFDMANPVCRSMNWSSAPNNPTLDGGIATSLDIHGSLYLTALMNINYTGNYNFKLGLSEAIINTATQRLSKMNFVGPAANTTTGTWNIANNLDADEINLDQGTLKLDRYTITSPSINLNTAQNRVFNLGTGNIVCEDGNWTVNNTSGLTLIPGSSEIRMTGNTGTFNGGGLTYHDLFFESVSTAPIEGTINGSNTFERVGVGEGGILNLEAGETQIVNQDFIAQGTCPGQITIRSTIDGSQANLSKTAGSTTVLFNIIKDINATGGGSFIADLTSDLGGNSGWTFTPLPTTLRVNIAGADAVCPGVNNGTAMANITGGITPFVIRWSNAQTVTNLTSLIPGEYSIFVTDSVGCTAADTVTIGQPATVNISATATWSGDTICVGTPTGKVNTTASNFLAPLSYRWSDGGATTQNRTDLLAGPNTVTVIDGNLCEATATATVASFDEVIVSFAKPVSACVSDSLTFLGTTSSNDAANVYDWDFGDGNTASGKIAGKHQYASAGRYGVTLTVTNSIGCIGSFIDSIDVYGLPTATATITPADCGVCNGEIALNLTGGSGNLQLADLAYTHTFDGSTIDANFEHNGPSAFSQNEELLVAGNTGWRHYFRSKTTYTREAGKEFTFSFYHPTNGDNMIGWYGAPAVSSYFYQDLVYGIRFLENAIQIYEDGSRTASIGNVNLPGNIVGNNWYEGRIVLKAVGAEFYIRRRGQTSWYHLHSSTRSSEDNLRLGITPNNARTGVKTDDWQVKTVDPDMTGLCEGPHTYTIIDAYGCSVPITKTVGTNDSQDPVMSACPSAVAVSTDATSCTATNVNLGTAPTATDDCGSPVISNNAPSAFPLGQTTIKWYATDGGGNRDSCSQTITVTDDVDPKALCKDISIALSASKTASVVVADINNGSNDNCSAVSVSIVVGQTSFDCADANKTRILKLEAIDNAGNKDSCEANVTITDAGGLCNALPTAVCKNIVVDADANCQATAIPSDFDNGSSDPEGTTLSLALSQAGPYAFGVTNLRLIVTDALGGKDSCNASITVNDTTPPKALCKDIAVSLDMHGKATIAAADVDNTSTDNCSIQSMSIDSTDFDCSETGANSVVLTVIDGGSNSASCTATVTVTDGINPTPVCTNLTIYLDANGVFSITAGDVDNGSADNCSIQSMVIDSTDFDCGETGANSVVLTVTDASGNFASCTSIVTVLDSLDPIAVCTDTTVYLDGNGTVSITPAEIDNGSSDNCSIQSSTINILSFDCTKIGTNPVTLSLTDPSGNMATCNSTVTVEDTLAPLVSCKNITVQLDVAQMASVSTGDIDNGHSDNCTSVILNLSGQNSFDCDDADSVRSVVLVATDTYGNADSCTASVTVADDNYPCNQAPVASCKNITVYTSAASCQGTAAAIAFNDGSTDPDGDMMTFTVSPAGPYGLGVTNVKLFVSDPSNVKDSCTATVTVIDNLDPSFTAPVDTFVYADDQCNYDASVTVTGDATNITDNCGTGLSAGFSDAVALVPNSTDKLITRTWSVNDGNGNIVTKNQLITVRDTIPVVFNLLGSNRLSIVRNSTTPIPGFEAYDNCMGDLTPNVVVDSSQFDRTRPAIYTVSYTLSYVDPATSQQVTQVLTLTIEVTGPPPTIALSANICQGQSFNIASIVRDYTMQATSFDFYTMDPTSAGATRFKRSTAFRGVARSQVMISPSVTTIYWMRTNYRNGSYLDIAIQINVSQCGVNTSPVVMLEGPYDASTSLMRDGLHQANLIPLTEPYTGLGYTFVHGGAEQIQASVLNVTGANAIVDWVVVELRDSVNSTQVVSSRPALLQRDGDVVDLDGISPVLFDLVEKDRHYFVAVRHRNHLATMTNQSLLLGASSTSVDFTDPALAVYGGATSRCVHVSSTGASTCLLFGGDADGNGQVQNTDNVLEWMLSVGTAGYKAADYNLDGQVQNSDMIHDWTPNVGRGGTVPR
ncbi:MAG: HYR domain-containing protein [Bacteroidia bacterium]